MGETRARIRTLFGPRFREQPIHDEANKLNLTFLEVPYIKFAKTHASLIELYRLILPITALKTSQQHQVIIEHFRHTHSVKFLGEIPKKQYVHSILNYKIITHQTR